jgi:hypothetical protein
LFLFSFALSSKSSSERLEFEEQTAVGKENIWYGPCDELRSDPSDISMLFSSGKLTQSSISRSSDQHVQPIAHITMNCTPFVSLRGIFV